tara:strand:+ start:2543 stop:2980 length:438 start_codon:yes stop_codon:yes gene_type:complete
MDRNITDKKIEEKMTRAEKANLLLTVIASCGRKFFKHGDRISRLEVAKNGRIWFIDSYSQKRVYTHYQGRWRGFTNGGTLKLLIELLRTYIQTGTKMRSVFGPWPKGYCGWGYEEEDMEKIREEAKALGIIEATPTPKKLEGAES